MSRWKLSFTLGKSNKPLKKLWVDYVQIYYAEKLWNIQKLKNLQLFIEAIDSYREQPISSIFEELDQNHEEIFSLLIESSNYYLKSLLKERDKYDEEAGPSLEFLQKSLYIAEIFLSAESKISVNKALDMFPNLPSSIISLIAASFDKVVLLSMLRITKRMFVNVTILKQFVRANVLPSLLFIYQKFQDTTFIQQIIYLLTLIIGNVRFTYQPLDKAEYYDVQRSRTLSTSSLGSASGRMMRKAQSNQRILNNNSSPVMGRGLEIGVETENKAAPSSLSFAWSVFSEIIKYTPIASTWLMTREEKSPDETASKYDDLNYHDFNLLMSNLVLTADEIEAEKNRLNSVLQDDQSFAEKVTDDSKDSEVLQFLEENQVKILSLLGTAIASAITPGDIISIITLISVIYPKNNKFQENFFDTDKVKVIYEMILRIEENLPLIAPNKFSTKNGGNNPTTTNKPGDILDKDEKGRFYSFAGGEFDEYYFNLVILLTKLLIDEQIIEVSTGISPFPRSYQIKNFGILELLQKLLNSRYHSLVAVAIRVCCNVIRLNPLNCVALEVKGILHTAIVSLFRLQFFGTLDKNEGNRVTSKDEGTLEDESSHSRRGNKPINPYDISSLELFQEFSLFLQLFAISYSRKDASLIGVFTFLLLSSWIPITADHSVLKNVRCMNCETEFACFECIAESCVKDKFYRLCKDCDQVFHKSTNKRRHIRLPLVQVCTLQTECHYDQQNLPKEIKCFNWNDILTSMQDHRFIVDYYIQIHDRFVKNDFLYWRETTSCLILKSIKGLIDDRKNRGLDFHSYIYESCGMVLRQSMMESSGIHDNSDNLRLYEKLFAKVLFFTDFDSSSQPPALNLFHPKRVLINNVLQIMSRFYAHKTIGEESLQAQLSDEKTILNLNSRQINMDNLALISSVIQHFLDFGIVGALIYAATEDSNFVPLISDDCQFIFWFLRESCVAAAVSKSDSVLAECLLWFNWLLSGESSITSGARNKGSSSHAPPNSKNKATGRLIETQKTQFLQSTKSPYSSRCRLPDGLPLITNVTKLMLLQEFRILVNGLSDGLILPETEPELNMGNNLVGLYCIPCQSSKESSNHAPGTSRKQRPSSAGLKRLSNKCDYAEVRFSVLYGSYLVKRKIIQAGIIKSLIEICAGERVPKTVQSILFSNHKNGISEDLNELEKELYWMSFILLLEIVTDSKESKDELDSVFGVSKFVKFLLRLLHSLDSTHLAVKFLERSLISFILELTVDGCRFFPPLKPFKSASTLFPRSIIHTDASSTQSLALISLPKSLLVEANLGGNSALSEDFFAVSDLSLSSVYFTSDQIAFWTNRIFVPQYSTVQNLLLMNEESYTLLSVSSFISLPLNEPRVSSEDGSQHSVHRDSDLIPPPPMLDASRSATLRRGSRKNFSSVSVHSLEENRWESESVGRMSGVQGDLTSRGSVNSHQSMQAVMQAVKATPAHLLLSSNLTNPETTNSNENVATINRKTLLKSAESLPHIDILEGQHIFPFPNFYIYNGNSQLPASNSNFLVNIESIGNIGIGKILVCCHNYLLCTSGLQKWIADENLEEGEFFDHETSPRKSTIDSTQPEWFNSEIPNMAFPHLTSVDGYYYVLRKHLSLYITPSANFSTLRSVNYSSPNYSWGRLRNERSVEILFTALLVGNRRVQSALLQSLIGLLEANPANAKLIGHSNVLSFLLARNFTMIQSGLQDYISLILTRCFSYLINLFSVRYFFEQAVHVSMTESIPEIMQNNAAKNLFIIGKSVEPQSPTSFLQFDMKNCLKSTLMLPPFSDGGNLSNGAITFACWLRVGAVGNTPSISLMQAISEPAGIVMNVFLRKLWQGASSTQEPQLQLCLSFSTKARNSASSHDHHFKEDFSDDLTWQSAVNFVLGAEDSVEFIEQNQENRSHESTIFSSSSTLMQSFVKFIFPDCIVDYNWRELGDWHLLVLTLHPEGVSCFIDGTERPVMYFSPFGYIAADAISTVAKASGMERCSFYPLKYRLKSMFESLQTSSKGNSLTAALGGLLFEKAMITDIIGRLDDDAEKIDVDSKSKLQAQTLKRLIFAYHNTIRGFSGLIGDVIFIDGKLDQEVMLTVARDGPSKGLQNVKGKILSSLIQQNPVTLPSDSLNTKGPNSAKLVSSRSNEAVSFVDIAKELESTMLPHENNSQLLLVHRSASLFKYFKAMGGLKLLFPLFTADVNVLVAALRVLSNLTYDEDDYSEFKSEKFDRVLLYCLASTRSQSNEVMQVIFDMILVSNPSSHHINPSTPPVGSSIIPEFSDRLKRIELLKLVMDLALAAFPNFYCCKTIAEWLKQTVSGSKENTFIFLKQVGFLPLHLLVSKWTITDFSEIALVLGEQRHSDSDSSSYTIQELDRKKVSFVEGNADANQKGSAYHASRHESIVSTATYSTGVTNNTNTSGNSGSGNSNEDNYRPVDLSDRRSLPPTRNNSIVDGKWLDTSQEYLAIFKTHLSGILVMKNVLNKLFLEGLLDQYLRSSGETPEAFNGVLVSTISFIVVCSRARISDPLRRDMTPKQKKESIRRSEKMKLLIKSHFRTVILLKEIDIFENRYWQLSSAVLLLNEVLKLGDSFWLKLKQIFPGQNLALLGLDLLNSESIEVKDCALRIIMMFLSGSDRKIDPKQMALFEKINGFQLMVENISNNAQYCSDMLIERLFSFLFWRLDDWQLLQTSSALVKERSIEVNPDGVDFGQSSNRNSKNLHNDGAITTETAGKSTTTTLELQGSNLASSAYMSPSSNRVLSTPSFDLYNSTEKMEILVPQIFEVIMKLLQYSKSVEQLKRCFSILESSFSSPEFISILKNRNEFNSKSSNYDSSPGGSSMKSDLQYTSRNLEAILSLKDWILNLTDIIIVFRRKWMTTNEDGEGFANQGPFSQSESESVGGVSGLKAPSSSHLSYDGDYFSGGESEDNNSTLGGGTEDGNGYEDSVSPDQNSLKDQQDYMITRQYILTQLTQPIFDFIKLLMIYDFTTKYSLNNKKWNEIFRLSLPETSNLQEELILYILENIHLNPFVSSTNDFNHDIGMNILRNLGYFVEQILEKMKLSLKCVSKIIQILYSLSYHCNSEMRNRMKDTLLPEVRKNCIIRCIIDVGQDVYLRIMILDEISTSLQGYLALTESKVMTDSQIIILILGMLVELLDDADYSEPTQYLGRGEARPINISNAPTLANNEGMTALLRILIKVIQNCIAASVECRKTVIKLCEGMFHDPKNLLIKGFLNTFTKADLTHRQVPKTSNIPATTNDYKHEMSSPSTSTTISNPSSTSTSTWWWGNSAPSVPLSAVGRQSSASSIATSKMEELSISVDRQMETMDVENGNLSPSTAKEGQLEGDPLAFVQWFSSFERRELQAEFRNRTIKELKNVLRNAEKLRERFSQRLLKYTKSLQDKRTRDRLSQSKQLSDSIVLVQSYNDKLAGTYVKEAQQYVKGLKERITGGYQQYHGIDVKGKRDKDHPTKFSFSDKNTEKLYQELSSLTMPNAIVEYLHHKEHLMHENSLMAGVRKEQSEGSSSLSPSSVGSLDVYDELLKYFEDGHKIQDKYVMH